MTKEAEIISKLADNERLLSGLYNAYASLFPAHHDFWIQLSEDEIDHANWVEALGRKIEDGSVQLTTNRFNLETLRQFSLLVREREAEAKAGNVSECKALSLSVDLERSLIEHKFFEVFEGDSVELEILLKALQYSTEHHLADVEKHWSIDCNGKH